MGSINLHQAQVTHTYSNGSTMSICGYWFTKDKKVMDTATGINHMQPSDLELAISTLKLAMFATCQGWTWYSGFSELFQSQDCSHSSAFKVQIYSANSHTNPCTSNYNASLRQETIFVGHVFCMMFRSVENESSRIPFLCGKCMRWTGTLIKLYVLGTEWVETIFF